MKGSGAVIWLTGFSGSGKSTLADLLFEEMSGRGFAVEKLDGDTVRDLFPQIGFTKEERDLHIKRMGFLASKLEKHGVFVIASFISPYRESRNFVRNLCKNFVEIYVSTPLEECERRDVKGLYAKARRGEINHFTGVSDPYETPESAELQIDTSRIDKFTALGKILDYLSNRGL